MKKVVLMLILLLLVINIAIAQTLPPGPPPPPPFVIIIPSTNGYCSVGEFSGIVSQPRDDKGVPIKTGIIVTGTFWDSLHKDGFEGTLLPYKYKVWPLEPQWKWGGLASQPCFGHYKYYFPDGFGWSTVIVPGPETNGFWIRGSAQPTRMVSDNLQNDPLISIITFGEDPNDKTTVGDNGCHMLSLIKQLENQGIIVSLTELITWLEANKGFDGWYTGINDMKRYLKATRGLIMETATSMDLDEALERGFTPTQEVNQKAQHWVTVLGYIVENNKRSYLINDSAGTGVSSADFPGGLYSTIRLIYPKYQGSAPEPKKSSAVKEEFLNKIQENSIQYLEPIERYWSDSAIIVSTLVEPEGMAMKLVKVDSSIEIVAEPVFFNGSNGTERRQSPRLEISNAAGGDYNIEITSTTPNSDYLVKVKEYNHTGEEIESVFQGKTNSDKVTIPLYHYAEEVNKSITDISGNVMLQNYSGVIAGMGAHIAITNGIDSEIHNVTLDANGNYSFVSSLNGNSTMTVKCSHWLGRSTTISVPYNGIATANFSLINGDVVENNEVDFSDINAVRTAYGSMPGDNSWNDRADVDGSGEVDFTDINIVRGKYGEVGD